MSNNKVSEKPRMDLQDIDVLRNEARVSPVAGFGSVLETPQIDVRDKINQFNPWTMLIMVGILIIFFVLFDTLGVTNTSQQGTMPNKALNVLEVIMWGVFIFLLMINGLQYFFELDVKTALVNLFSPEPRIDMQVDSKNIEVEEKPVSKEEVFHVPGNKYTYKQAKAVCKAFNSEIANYSQIEDAYNNGGEWCSYGWSADQMALFPTQKVTWEKLQKKSKCGTNGDCGRPGINGGYMANPNIRFGVNCYGVKPEETDELKQITNPFPKSKDELEIEDLASKYKKQINKLKLSPFNKENWKQI
jgi:hypothetical protein